MNDVAQQLGDEPITFGDGILGLPERIGNDAIIRVQLTPNPGIAWRVSFEQMPGYAGPGNPPELDSQGVLTIRGSMNQDDDASILRVIDAVRAHVEETNKSHHHALGDGPGTRQAELEELRGTLNNHLLRDA